MRNKKVSQKVFNFVCCSCGRTIIPGEKMLTIYTSIETPNLDGSIEQIESSVIYSVCLSCASDLTSGRDFLISEADDEVKKERTL